MHWLPKRTSLAAETAVTLKKWIAEGELSGLLPGELRLKSRLGVGRDTLRLALKSLRSRAGFYPPKKVGNAGCARSIIRPGAKPRPIGCR